MTAKEIANKIPAEYRKEILETNMIAKAHVSREDPIMSYLAIVWKTYVEPAFEPACNLCLERVLRHFRAIQASLVELERESRLLDEL